MMVLQLFRKFVFINNMRFFSTMTKQLWIRLLHYLNLRKLQKKYVIFADTSKLLDFEHEICLRYLSVALESD